MVVAVGETVVVGEGADRRQRDVMQSVIIPGPRIARCGLRLALRLRPEPGDHVIEHLQFGFLEHAKFALALERGGQVVAPGGVDGELEAVRLAIAR